MTTQAAVSGNPYKNNGGTVIKGGNATTTTGSPFTSNKSLIDMAVVTPYGSQIALSSGSTGSSGNVGTFKSLTSGTFAYRMVAGRYIMKRATAFVNGSASTFLTSGASESAERTMNPAVLETGRTLGSGATASFDVFTGTLTKGGNYGGSMSWGTDNEARPTNAVPGELAYKTSAKLPVADEYAPKYAP